MRHVISGVRPGWLVIACAALLLALVGCSSDEATPTAGAPGTASVSPAEIVCENPAIPPVTLYGVACLGSTTAVCGSDGFAALYDHPSGTWRTLDTGVGADLQAVWGTSPTDIYIAGYQGCFLHWDGTALTALDVSAQDWRDMWGAASDDVWLVSLTEVVHWQGTMSTRYGYSDLPIGFFYEGVGGSAADNVYVTASSGLMRWDGVAWTAVDAGTGATDLYDVTAVGDEVFVAGYDRLLAHFDGTSWSSFTAPGSTFQQFRTVVPGIIAGNVLAFGADRLMYRWNGTAWVDFTDAYFTSGYDFMGVCAASNRIVAVGTPGGENSNVARLTSGTWSTLAPSSIPPSNLNDVWVLRADHAVAVGDDGTIVHRDASGWSDVPHGLTSENLYAVWGAGAGDIYAVGDDGVVLHGDGVAWTSVDIGAGTQELYDVDGNGADNVWIVGNRVLQRWNGLAWTSRWSELPDTLAYYEALYVAPDGDVFVAGDVLAHYDGTVWKGVPIKHHASPGIMDMWGTSSRDVWLAGYYGVYRYDGSTVALRWTGDAFSYGTAVTGRGANNVMAGAGGELIQFANGIPSVVPFPNGNPGVTGASTGRDGTTYFVGANGLIARVE